jgi:hypothetical protein
MNSDFEKIKNKISNPTSFGPGIWYVIHLLARDANNETKKLQFKQFIENVVQSLPCSECQKHATEYYQKNPLKDLWDLKEDGNEIGMFKWAWTFHNTVNNRLKKPFVSWDNAKMLFSKEDGVCTSECGKEEQKPESVSVPHGVGIPHGHHTISMRKEDIFEKYIPKTIIRPNSIEKMKSRTNRFRNV